MNTIKAITNLVFVENEILKSDIILVPGSSHIQLIEKSVELFNKGVANLIVYTGGFNSKIDNIESEWAKEYALSKEIPEKSIIIETKSTNTMENALEAEKILKQSKVLYKIITLVTKNQHSRRSLMTFSKVFTKSEIKIVSVEDTRGINKENWYKDKEKSEIVMGEVEKIGKYFLKGDLDF